MIRRLRVKFICINMAVATVMLLAILGMLLHFTHDNLEQQSIRVMQSVMADRASPGRPGEFPRQAQLPYFYVSVNTLGELSASFGGYYDLTDTAAIQEIITLALNSGEDTGILKDYSLRFQKRTTPFGQTIVFVDMSSELATMRSLTNTCIGIGVLGFAVFLGLSFLLARWAVKPVETAWNQQRQFVADASHELKTPLAILDANLSVIRSNPEETVESQEKWLSAMEEQSARMNGLIADMLTLAKLDAKQDSGPVYSIDFSQLVTGCLLSFEAVAFESGVRMDTDLTAGVSVSGNREQLSRLVYILLDNAVRHAPAGGRVWVTLQEEKGRAVFRVKNTGEISQEALPHIFDRFYRTDAARSRDSGGFGLGLAIAHSISRENRAKLTAGSRDGTTCFTVEFGAKKSALLD